MWPLASHTSRARMTDESSPTTSSRPLTNVGVTERVHELGDVAAGLPHLAGQDDRRVQPDDVLPAGGHRVPPLALDVVLHLHAQRAVVPGGAQAPVDIAGGEDEATALGEADNRVDAVVTAGHQDSIRLAVGGRAGAPWPLGQAHQPSLLPVNSPEDPVGVDVQGVPAHGALVRALVLLDPARSPPPALQQVREATHVALVVPHAAPHRIRL